MTTASASPTSIETPVQGVTALESTTKVGGGRRITKRLYKCSNGWSLGARRGGVLHLADDDTWEIFVLDPMGIANGEPAGFVTDATMDKAVARLAGWFQ